MAPDALDNTTVSASDRSPLIQTSHENMKPTKPQLQHTLRNEIRRKDKNRLVTGKRVERTDQFI